MGTNGIKLRVIRGAAPVRMPLADRCIVCHGRRVIADPETDSIVRCPCCNHPKTPAESVSTPIATGVLPISRAA